MGFVPKRSSSELLQDAVHLVMSGGIYMPELVPTDRVEPGARSRRWPRRLAWRRPDGPCVPARARCGPAARWPISGLTPRQRQVMQLLLHGKSNKLIARDLGISVETVKDHVAAVLRSLGVTSRTQAVLAVGLMGDLSEGSLS